MASHPPGRLLLSAPSTGLPRSENAIRTRTKKAPVACTECRKRRMKCSGGVPCDRCQHSQATCILDEYSDGRRKAGIERRLEALERDRCLLMGLVGSIRNDNEHELNRALDSIRRNDSLDEIRQSLAESQTPGELEHGQQELHDDPLYRVPAQPWTSVTDDNNYVSHLISLYFTWNHPVQSWIDRNLFVRDMQSGCTDSLFCSAFLVNALLAVASFYSNSPILSTLSTSPRPGGLEFYNEAKWHLDQEEGKLSLAGFQGRCAMYISTCGMGKNMLGWQYLVEIADCAQELMIRRNTLIARAREQDQEISRALNVAIIGSLSVPPVAFASLHQLSIMPEPTCERPPQDHSEGDMWFPYPLKSDSVSTHGNCVTNALFNLQLILWDVSNSLFGASGQQLRSSSEDMANAFKQRLEEWALQIPECAMLETGRPTPAILDMHMRYHNAIISIFDGIGVSINISELNTLRTGIGNIRVSAARTLSLLLGLHTSYWPAIYMPLNYIHYAKVALLTLLDDLDNEESTGSFVSSFTALHTWAGRLPLAKDVLQDIQLKATQCELELPREITSLSSLGENS